MVYRTEKGFFFRQLFVFVLLSSCLSVALFADVLPLSGTEPNQLIVSDVLGVYSANTFLCRFYNPPLSHNVIFRVHIPSVVAEDDPNTVYRAVCFVNQLFSSARNITLCDIRRQSYFGIRAKVLVDGRDMGGLLIEKGLAKPAAAPAVADYAQRRPAELTASSSPGRPIAFEVERPEVVSLSAMLKRRVNLGQITPQTTIKEALEELSASQKPALPIIVLWTDLQTNCLLDPDTPVGVDGLTDIPTLLALKQILRSAAAGGPLPVIRIEKNTLTIGSKQTFPEKRAAGVYQIDELVGTSFYEDSI